MEDRELDALVAEKVMGWHESIDYDYKPPQINWANKDGVFAAVKNDPRNPEGVNHLSAFCPAGDVATAIEVLETFGDGPWRVERFDSKQPYEVLIVRDEGAATFRAKAETLPRAICLAALKAFRPSDSEAGRD